MKKISDIVLRKLLNILHAELKRLYLAKYKQSYLAKITDLTQPMISNLIAQNDTIEGFTIGRVVNVLSRLNCHVVINTKDLSVEVSRG